MNDLGASPPERQDRQRRHAGGGGGDGCRDQRTAGGRQRIPDQRLTSVILAVSLAEPGGVAVYEGIGSQFASAAPQPAPGSHAMTPTTEPSIAAYPPSAEGDVGRRNVEPVLVGSTRSVESSGPPRRDSEGGGRSIGVIPDPGPASARLRELDPGRARRRARRRVTRHLHASSSRPFCSSWELGPHPPAELYRAYLAQSDIFIGLYWERYGWIGPDMDISGLEDEFRLSGSIPRLLYIKAPAPDREPRLAAMIEELQTEGTDSYRSFRTPTGARATGPGRSRRCS